MDTTWLHGRAAGSRGAVGRLHSLMDPLSEEQLMREKEHLFFILNFCLQATNNIESFFFFSRLLYFEFICLKMGILP